MLLPERAALTRTAWLICVAAGDKIVLYDI